jgi:hypothetical protein
VAKESKRHGVSSDRHPGSETVKLEDIYTAAKSTMEPADYSRGYPPQPGIMRNANLTTKGASRGRD